jgi:hypothetical protein
MIILFFVPGPLILPLPGPILKSSRAYAAFFCKEAETVATKILLAGQHARRMETDNPKKIQAPSSGVTRNPFQSVSNHQTFNPF